MFFQNLILGTALFAMSSYVCTTSSTSTTTQCMDFLLMKSWVCVGGTLLAVSVIVINFSLYHRQADVTQRQSWLGSHFWLAHFWSRSEMLFFLFSDVTPQLRKLFAALPPSQVWQQLWIAGCPASREALSEARHCSECHKTRWFHLYIILQYGYIYIQQSSHNAVWHKVGKAEPLLKCV